MHVIWFLTCLGLSLVYLTNSIEGATNATNVGKPSETGDQDDEDRYYVWSFWSPCSRSCGIGIRFRGKRCIREDKSLCRRFPRQYQACNTQACPSDANDFRTVQCSRFNDRQVVNGEDYRWIAHHQGRKNCLLYCRPSRHPLPYYFGRAIDGTQCAKEPHSVCVYGKCVPMGCDGKLDSPSRLDKCRVCDGNNTTCERNNGTLKKTPTTEEKSEGYAKIMTIPKGATSVMITETTHNYIALKNARGEYVLNGNRILNWPRMFKAGTTDVKYERKQGEKIEMLKILGPTSEVVTVMAMLMWGPAVIKYDYWQPLQAVVGHTPPVASDDDDLSVKNGNTNQGGSIWGEWTICTVSCGGGFKVRARKCGAGSKSVCDGTETETAKCNEMPCKMIKASWSPWRPWGGCSATCGGGAKMRFRHCRLGDKKNNVKHSCPGKKFELMLCNTSPCPTSADKPTTPADLVPIISTVQSTHITSSSSSITTAKSVRPTYSTLQTPMSALSSTKSTSHVTLFTVAETTAKPKRTKRPSTTIFPHTRTESTSSLFSTSKANSPLSKSQKVSSVTYPIKRLSSSKPTALVSTATLITKKERDVKTLATTTVTVSTLTSTPKVTYRKDSTVRIPKTASMPNISTEKYSVLFTSSSTSTLIDTSEKVSTRRTTTTSTKPKTTTAKKFTSKLTALSDTITSTPMITNGRVSSLRITATTSRTKTTKAKQSTLKPTVLFNTTTSIPIVNSRKVSFPKITATASRPNTTTAKQITSEPTTHSKTTPSTPTTTSAKVNIPRIAKTTSMPITTTAKQSTSELTTLSKTTTSTPTTFSAIVNIPRLTTTSSLKITTTKQSTAESTTISKTYSSEPIVTSKKDITPRITTAASRLKTTTAKQSTSEPTTLSKTTTSMPVVTSRKVSTPRITSVFIPKTTAAKKLTSAPTTLSKTTTSTPVVTSRKVSTPRITSVFIPKTTAAKKLTSAPTTLSKTTTSTPVVTSRKFSIPRITTVFIPKTTTVKQFTSAPTTLSKTTTSTPVFTSQKVSIPRITTKTPRHQTTTAKQSFSETTTQAKAFTVKTTATAIKFTTTTPKQSTAIGQSTKLSNLVTTLFPSRQVVTSPGSTKFQCPPCKVSKKRNKSYCKSDYVLKVRARKVTFDESSEATVYRVNVKYVFETKISVDRKAEIWVRGRCRCPSLKLNVDYLVMGSLLPPVHTGNVDRLSLSHESYVKTWKRGMGRKIQRLKGSCDTGQRRRI